jgi:hypothetical protein
MVSGNTTKPVPASGVPDLASRATIRPASEASGETLLWERSVGARPIKAPRGVYQLRGRAVAAAAVAKAQSLIAAATKENQAANARKLANPRVEYMDATRTAFSTPLDPSVP